MVLAGVFLILADNKSMISSLFSFFSQPKNQNLRRVPRYGVGSLRAWIQKPGLLGLFEKHVELSPIDFNQTGMAFHHDDLLIPGQSIVLDLEKGDHNLASIAAVVRYTSQHVNHYRSGVEFNFGVDGQTDTPELRQELIEIEALLKDVEVI
jgi:hypothetical protein